MTPSKPGRLTIGELREAGAAGTLDTVLVAVADIQGRLQGKRVDAAYFLDEVVEQGTEGCGYLLASDVEMATVDGFALSSWDDGYGDLRFRPDLSSLRRVPWHEATAVVLCDVETTSGAPVSASPRQVLQRQAARLAERGWTALGGTELEFIVFNDTYEQAWPPGYRALTPANLYNVDYSLQGTARVEPLLGRIRRAMRGAGMQSSSPRRASATSASTRSPSATRSSSTSPTSTASSSSARRRSPPRRAAA